MKNKQLPELLIPAGDLNKAYVAFRYGADAIYCGVPMFSLRTKENTFTEENIAEIVNFAHQNNKKVYITTNAFPHQHMIAFYEKHFSFLEKIQPDGIIFADLGVLSLANSFAPTVPKHLSVQTSTVNLPAIKLWQDLGVSRIILAREMAIREVAEIHRQVPEMELEYFVHGAVCMAYSGRCLLSNFTGGRDANQGVCNHTCRWNYKVYDEEGREINTKNHTEKEAKISQENSCSNGKSKSIRDFEQSNFIEEEERQGQIIPVEEDFHGTHIMSSKDMCMIENLQEISSGGVCSLKVEGRNKTSYYVATIARAYRQALDDLKNEKEFNENLWREIHATANRGFFPGFLHGKPREGSIQYGANRSISEQEFCGIVLGWKNDRVEIQVKNKIQSGDEITFVMPKMIDDFNLILSEMKFGEEDVEILHGGNDNKIASFSCEKEVPIGTFIRQSTKNPAQIK